MQKLDFSLAPTHWAICFQDECPLKNACLRYAIGHMAPAKLTHHSTVLPAARRGDQCTLFATKEPVRMARGMKGLLTGVRTGDAQEMREQLFDIFGSRRQFYRYRNGEYEITPRQQALVAQLFRQYGYEHQVAYDHESEQYYFPDE